MSGALPREGWRVAEFQALLLVWFAQNKRQFPWRETSDPFAVLVAEKLLQQTQACDDVVLAYQTILDTYPSPEALRDANLADLQSIVRPLGLIYRAAELKTMAAEIAGRHKGVVPDDLSSLMALPGVGAYGARAVMSFAFGYDVAVVDTNVARIFYRVFGILGRRPSNPARKQSLVDLANALLPPGRARDFNLALLDLGASICKAKSPDCPGCPVLGLCEYGNGVIEPGQDTLN